MTFIISIQKTHAGLYFVDWGSHAIRVSSKSSYELEIFSLNVFLFIILLYNIRDARRDNELLEKQKRRQKKEEDEEDEVEQSEQDEQENDEPETLVGKACQLCVFMLKCKCFKGATFANFSELQLSIQVFVQNILGIVYASIVEG